MILINAVSTAPLVCLQEGDDDQWEVGTVCGVNIKPIYTNILHTSASPFSPYRYDVIMGIFLHVRMPDGDQYDLIWNLVRDMDTEERISFASQNTIYKDDVGIWKCRHYVKCALQALYSITRIHNGAAETYYNGFSFKPKSVKEVIKNKLKKKDIVKMELQTPLIIPQIFELCGVNEWVELIGSKVRLRLSNWIRYGRKHTEQPYVAVAPADRQPTDYELVYIQPDMIEIHSNDPVIIGNLDDPDLFRITAGSLKLPDPGDQNGED